jgi:hypothetical protein
MGIGKNLHRPSPAIDPGFHLSIAHRLPPVVSGGRQRFLTRKSERKTALSACGHKFRHRVAMPGDDDCLALLDQFKESGQLGLGFMHIHLHAGRLGLLSPAVVHYGLALETIERRRAVLDAAYSAHPERFVRKPPQPLPAPKDVWINKPQPTPENKTQ